MAGAPLSRLADLVAGAHQDGDRPQRRYLLAQRDDRGGHRHRQQHAREAPDPAPEDHRHQHHERRDVEAPALECGSRTLPIAWSIAIMPAAATAAQSGPNWSSATSVARTPATIEPTVGA